MLCGLGPVIVTSSVPWTLGSALRRLEIAFESFTATTCSCPEGMANGMLSLTLDVELRLAAAGERP